MPIYEFYCADCHAIYQFLSRAVNTGKRPACPRCGRKRLTREVSRFAITGRAREQPDDQGDLPVDESKVMQALASLEHEAEHLSEDDPRQAASLMRKFAGMTGMPLGGAMEEAITRMEAGEDPEAVEQDLGERLDAEDPFQPSRSTFRAMRRALREPDRDPELYDL